MGNVPNWPCPHPRATAISARVGTGLLRPFENPPCHLYGGERLLRVQPDITTSVGCTEASPPMAAQGPAKQAPAITTAATANAARTPHNSSINKNSNNSNNSSDSSSGNNNNYYNNNEK